MVELLRKLVEAESPSDVPDSQVHCLSILMEELQSLDYQVELIRGRQTGGHLLARPVRMVAEGPRQLLLGHCDTVWPIGTLKQMPFIVEGNTARGPGVYDMKGGLVQMLYALKAVQALGVEPPVAPDVFINTDEEIGSHESGIYIRALAQETDRVFVLEPSLGSSGRLKTARKGVGRFHVEVNGVAAHAGLDPEKGRSAILELSHIIQQLFALNDPETGVSVNVGLVAGGLRPNVIAPSSTAEIDVRVPTQDTARLIEQTILSITPVTEDVEVTIMGQVNRAPLERTPANQALWHLAQGAAAEMGIQIDQGVAGGGSDGNTTSQFTATLDGLGAVGDGAHATHEFIYLDKMLERSALLGLLLLA
ncbi:MAG: M20 family metallopeptidase [Chloroflexota bacterium]|nr:MAG: M20 family metallopeptidase [Chloroflexota bacterium]